MDYYLELEDLWEAVEGTETKAKKIKKAKAKIILCIEEINFVHIHDCKTAKEVWDALKSAFEDNGLSNRFQRFQRSQILVYIQLSVERRHHRKILGENM
jgi:5'-deoxynucleotidase YfbR-like HD superfamily hydrolase